MSIGSILNMARSGMNAQQAAIQTASQNISNAQTEGYSRQRVELVSSLPTAFPNGIVGTGVSVAGITRARDILLDATFRSDSSGAAAADTTSGAMTQIQSVFGEPSNTGLSAALDAFWSGWSNLSANPTNSAAKSVVREAGNNVANTLNHFASQLDQLDQSNRETINADVNQVNSLVTRIAQYNQQIIGSESSGNSANDLRDARDKLLDEVTKIAGGQVVERANGSAAIYLAGRAVVDGSTVKQLQMNTGQPPTVTFTGSATAITGLGGSLGAAIDVSANRIPTTMARLDSLASGLVQTVNSIHSTGKIFTGSPPVATAAGNFFGVTIPPPTGVDPLQTARGIRLAATLTDGSAVAASGATATGPGNNDVAMALAALSSTAVTLSAPSGFTTATFGDFFNATVGDVATATKQAQDDSTVQTTLASSANSRRQSVSGVSTDEELISVIQHQHAYQAAARLVNVVNEMTQTLITLGQ